ncbi:MAG: S8 family serine peptidase, partial [Chloroflexi bacterium]|nr:S8 family serine peptidase [Chloroflexota bacterium]
MHTPCRFRRSSTRAIAPRLLLILVLVAIVGPPAQAGAVAPEPAGVAPSPVALLQDAPGYAPRVVLVGFHPPAGGQGFAPEATPLPSGGIWDALHAAGKPEAVFPFARQAGHALAPEAAEALGRIYRYRAPEGLSVEDVVDILSVDPAVAYAEPDYLAVPAVTPNDPRYSEQWALGAIGAPAAWDVTTGAGSVAIAVVDSGVDLTHPDLAAQLWTNPGETPGNGADDDGNGLVDDVHGWNTITNTGDVSDAHGHGTQVVGVLGAAGDNGAGIAGMCWGCRVLAAKAMQDSGAANYSDIAEAVAYAAGQGAGVINVSLGGYADSQTLRTAVQSAAATAVVVAGAGNDALTTPFYPAAYPEAVAVASVAEGDALAASSNRGPWVDIAAPGEGILTTLAGGGYGEASGTSLATALVAGTAGLLRSAHPEWSPALVRQHLLLTAADIAAQNPDDAGMYGTGRLDAGAALAQAPQPQVAVTGWAVDGEADERPAPGTALTLALTIENEWLPGRALVGTLTESDPHATVTDATGTFGDLNTGQSRDNAGDTFGVTLAASTPYSHPIAFTLRLTGSDGYA